MDDIDRQVERDQIFLDAGIAMRKPVLYPTGRCFNCDENIPTNACYCDADCRADHEKETRLRAAHPAL